MVFTLGLRRLRHTFILWHRSLTLVEFSCSSDIVRFVQGGVVKTFRYPLDLPFYEGLLFSGLCNFLRLSRTHNGTYLRTCSTHRQQGAYQQLHRH